MYISIEILRAFTCLLIVNFHCLELYPESIKVLSFGGDIGNNTFFLISGFLLAPTISRTSLRDMWSGYLRRRFIKLLPMCTVFNLLGFCFFSDEITIGSFVRGFVFPTFYWFTGAIVLFYPLIFLVGKLNNIWYYAGIVTSLIVLHLVFDSLSTERYIIGFIAMISGVVLRNYLLSKYEVKRPGVLLIASGFVFGVFSILKIIYAKGVEPQRVIHLLIGLLTIILASTLLIGLFELESELQFVKKKEKIYRLISLLSNMTLAIYLCQAYINFSVVNYFKKLTFPFSLVIYLAFVFGISYAVYYIDKIFREKILAKLRYIC